ncbi:serine hydrolase domain-containing protein [Terracidiphilus gabretensis]|uniref:serine hydrolase domain-containing protein n=1 Tax=Terracidiphilus gabretensis TaxID=1577687 RepID=UPI00071B3464|nr:serine hydrolase domain-containing protein [Terracidiphilus gabretensis]
MPILNRKDFLRNTALAGLGAVAGRVLAYGQSAKLPVIDQEIRQYMERYSVPGMTICFLRGKDLLYSEAFGLADRSTGTPVTAASLFRIASNSKAFTSASIFLLIETGKLQLEQTVFSADGILPQYSNLGGHKDWLHSITVHQLLTHTSGGWSNQDNDPMFEKGGFNHDQLIEWTLKTHELQYPPGQHYAYSNFGYCVLGRVIEKVSGMPYPQFVHQHILNRIGDNDMRIATHKPVPNEVTYYGQNGENPYGIPITRMDSHGGWIATSEDMARFLACLFTPEDQEGATPVLSPASLKTMTTGTSANPDYACGLEINRAGNAWHNGSLPGTISLMVHTHSGCSWAAVLNTRTSQGTPEPDLDKMLWRIGRDIPGYKP